MQALTAKTAALQEDNAALTAQQAPLQEQVQALTAETATLQAQVQVRMAEKNTHSICSTHLQHAQAPQRPPTQPPTHVSPKSTVSIASPPPKRPRVGWPGRRAGEHAAGSSGG